MNVTDIAVNMHGHALRDVLSQRLNFELINALHPPSSRQVYARIQQIQDNEERLSFRNDMKFTRQETEQSRPGTAPYLVVGYALRSPQQWLLMRNEALHGQKPVGMIYTAGMLDWDHDEPPLYVVAPTLEQSERVKLYALLPAPNGLCMPFVVKKELVFYRHEFRHANTAF